MMDDESRKKLSRRYAKKLLRTEYYGTVDTKDLLIGVKHKGSWTEPGYVWAPYIPIQYPPGYKHPWYKRLYRFWLRLTGRIVRVGGKPKKKGTICYY
jgi:hypothetical protein